MFIDEARIRIKAGDGGNGCHGLPPRKIRPPRWPLRRRRRTWRRHPHASARSRTTPLVHFRFNPEHKSKTRRTRPRLPICREPPANTLVLQSPRRHRASITTTPASSSTTSPTPTTKSSSPRAVAEAAATSTSPPPPTRPPASTNSAAPANITTIASNSGSSQTPASSASPTSASPRSSRASPLPSPRSPTTNSPR